MSGHDRLKLVRVKLATLSFWTSMAILSLESL
jgi:hypothetical protein